MNRFLLILFTFLLTCQKPKISNNNFELFKVKNSEALLILFPGGGSTSKETKRDFKILRKAIQNKVSVLLMDFNRHLWIDTNDAENLKTKIIKIVNENNLQTDNIYIGGMSIGGTVALSLSNYLAKTKSQINPKGVFVVDAPIDLYGLYKSAQKDLLRTDFSKERLAEPKWIVNYFEEAFGKDSLLINIQKVAPITLQTNNTTNLDFLKFKKFRLYTEPDTLWYKSQRQTDFESTNAYTLQKTAKLLNAKKWKKTTLIQTENKGYRFDGQRHPHSWSIVNVDELLKWILN